MSDEQGPWESTGYNHPIDPEDRGARRKREPRHAEPATWEKPRIAAMAKCQAHVAGCPNLVEVTEEAMGMMQAFDSILAKRGDEKGSRAPLGLNNCFPCDSCLAKRKAAAEDRSAHRRTKSTEAIRFLKACDPNVLEEADELVKASRLAPPNTRDAVIAAMERMGWLGKVMGKGYVTDLLGAIRDRRANGKGKRGDL